MYVGVDGRCHDHKVMRGYEMSEEAITEGANAINNLTAAAPALGALAIVIVIFGVILFSMQRSQHQFISKMQKQQEEQLDKTIEFVGNFAAMMQSDRDTTQLISDSQKELSRVVSELNKDCRLRFDKDGDVSG